MTAPNILDDNKARISRNIDKMRSAGAPDSEIESYIQSEGLQPVAHGGGRDIPAPEKDPYNYGSRDAALNGLTGGFSDEVLSAIKSRSLFRGPEYEKELARENRGKERYSQAHPYAEMGSEALGMAVPAALTGGVNLAAKLGVGSALGQAAVNQGALGALYGAGNAGPGSRAAGAAVGGVAGGVAGGVSHLGMKALQAVAELTPGINTIGKALHLLPSSADRADQVILKSIGRDETTPAAMRAKALADADTKPETVLDMGGENLTSLGRLVANSPGTTRREFGKLVDARQPGAGTRMSEDLTSVGVRPVNQRQTAEALIATKKVNAKPLYETALMDPDPIDDPAINAFLGTPEGKSAFHIAEDMRRKEAAGEALRAGRPLKPSDYALPQIYDLHTGELTSHPDASTLHWMKLALDKMVKGYDYVAPGGTASQTNRLDKSVAAGFRKHIGTLIPGYDQAAGQYASDQALQDAFESGTNMLGEKPGALADVAAMTPGEKDLYKLGGGSAIRNASGDLSEKGSVYTKVFGTDNKQARIANMLDDPAAFDKFSREMGREKRMAEVNRLQGGSHTQPIAIEGADAVHALGWLTRILKNPVYGISNALIRGGNGMTEDVNNAIGARLLSGGMQNSQAGRVAALEALMKAQGPRFNKSGALASLIAALTGSTSGEVVR